MVRETGVQSQADSKKWYLITSLLNSQHYKVRFKGKVK